jgi:putative transposase
MDILRLIQEGKVKRYFRSREKLSYRGAINHITQRAPGREKLFVEESDYLYMLHLLKKSSKEFKLRLFSFVLMSNHVHLLFQLQEDNLSRAMQHLFHTYACYFNKKYERKGHSVCGRYRQALCFDETYLLASSIYIHINPVVAGIVKRFEDYRWSSVALFTTPVSKRTFIDYTFILNLLDDDLASARVAYSELMNRSISIKVGNIWDNHRAIDRFRDMLLTPLKEIIEDHKNARTTIVIDSVTDDFATYKRKRDPTSKAAKAYVVAQLIAKGYTITEIAKKLEISKRAVYSVMKSNQS